MKIYFAGDITEGDWRFSFMTPDHLRITAEYVQTVHAQTPSQWPAMRRAVFNTFDYVGPFLEEDVDEVREFFAALAGQEEGVGNLLSGVAEADCLVAYVSPDLPFDRAALEIGYALAKKKPVFFVCADGGWETHRVANFLIGDYAADFVFHSRDPGGDLRRMLMKATVLVRSL